MKTIWLDSRNMKTIKETHHYLKHKLDLPSYYGGNLDALWDLLSTKSEPLQINLLNRAHLNINLGEYGDKLIQVFRDAENFNHNLIFRVVNNLRFARVDLI